MAVWKDAMSDYETFRLGSTALVEKSNLGNPRCRLRPANSRFGYFALYCNVGLLITPAHLLPNLPQEEAGIDANLVPCGILFFQLAGYTFAHKVHIFRADDYSGTVTE